MTDDNLQRWLIGGPARCGKSALAEVLARENDSLAVMRVDALLHLYRDIGPFFQDAEATEFLRSYLLRPRFMDAQKEKTRCPLDDFPDDIEQVIADVAPQAGMNGLEILAAAFDVLARSRNMPGWAVLDLHPELNFQSYAAAISNLKLLVCLRDPFEAITASLFWRSFPDRPDQFKRQRRYLSSLWVLAASVALSLRKAAPDSVFIISSNDMFEGNAVLPGQLNLRPEAFSNLFNGPAYFSARKSNDRVEFYCPDGQWHQLLDDHEVAAIERWRRNWWMPELFSAQQSAGVSARGGILWVVAGRHPSLCKAALDFAYSPFAGIRRRASKLKHALGKTD